MSAGVWTCGHCGRSSQAHAPGMPSADCVHEPVFVPARSRWEPAGIVASGPFEALSDMARGMWLDQAGRLLASPALDAVVAERVAAALDEAADLLAPFSGIGMSTQPTRAEVSEWLRRRAAALTERSQTDE